MFRSQRHTIWWKFPHSTLSSLRRHSSTSWQVSWRPLNVRNHQGWTVKSIVHRRKYRWDIALWHLCDVQLCVQVWMNVCHRNKFNCFKKIINNQKWVIRLLFFYNIYQHLSIDSNLSDALYHGLQFQITLIVIFAKYTFWIRTF